MPRAPRPPRLLVLAMLGLSTLSALSGLAAGATLNAPPASAVTGAPHGGHRTAVAWPGGHLALDAPEVSASSSTTSERRAAGPIGSRTAHLTQHPVPASTTVAARRVRSADVRQDVAPGTISARVRLRAAPTQTTDSEVVVAFGNLTTSGGQRVCDSPRGANVRFAAYGKSARPTLVRDGARLVLRGYHLKAARTATWDCAFVQTRTTDSSTRYDSVNGSLVEHVQPPRLSFASRSTPLHRGEFTTVRLRVHNAASTVARARRVRLTWTTRGLVVRGSHRLGGIAPGDTVVAVLRFKPTAARGSVRFTASAAGGYTHAERFYVRPTPGRG